MTAGKRDGVFHKLGEWAVPRLPLSCRGHGSTGQPLVVRASSAGRATPATAVRCGSRSSGGHAQPLGPPLRRVVT
ncbi:unnamed protein product [Lampetra planeri]